jgi:hypothetical protein
MRVLQCDAILEIPEERGYINERGTGSGDNIPGDRLCVAPVVVRRCTGAIDDESTHRKSHDVLTRPRMLLRKCPPDGMRVPAKLSRSSATRPAYASCASRGERASSKTANAFGAAGAEKRVGCVADIK